MRFRKLDTAGPQSEDLDAMPLLDHLNELRMRIIRALLGIGVTFAVSLTFSNQMWQAVSAPAEAALRHLGYPPHLVQLDPMESFSIIWIELPAVCAIFLSAPWILYQAWAFVAPGLYREERRWVAPCIICTSSCLST